MKRTFKYMPILKTRPSENKAYEKLTDVVKDRILPIIEMTGARSYKYPKTHKTLAGVVRPGDINKKIDNILSLVKNRPFILDITDDESLMYDGINIIKNPENGYQEWRRFLTKNEKFKQLVIPTIQFDTNYIADTFLQIQELNKEFRYLALKISAFKFNNPDKCSNLFNVHNLSANTIIQSIIDKIVEITGNDKLILILDFGFISEFEKYKSIIDECLNKLTNTKHLKAIIPVSSSFPSYVKPVPEHTFEAQEELLYSHIKNTNNYPNICFGDYASLHPVKYPTSGGGWIPRIDYIENTEILKYSYKRASSDKKNKNNSDAYEELAKLVVNASNYQQIDKLSVWGDEQIDLKSKGENNGNAPSFWISVRANLYMTILCSRANSNLVLDL